MVGFHMSLYKPINIVFQNYLDDVCFDEGIIKSMNVQNLPRIYYFLPFMICLNIMSHAMHILSKQSSFVGVTPYAIILFEFVF